MNNEQRMDLFDREQNQRMLKAAVLLAESVKFHGSETQWRGFADAEYRRLTAKLQVMATWTRDEEYMAQSVELQARETALLERLRIACEQNAEIVV